MYNDNRGVYMEKDQKYGYWIYESTKPSHKDGHFMFINTCSACGYKATNNDPDICPQCSAIMVEPLEQTDINGRDICAGDVVKCNIAGHKEKVEGTVVNDGMWYLDNPVDFRFIYDCKNFEIVKGIIPAGKHLSKEFDIEEEDEEEYEDEDVRGKGL